MRQAESTREISSSHRESARPSRARLPFRAVSAARRCLVAILPPAPPISFSALAFSIVFVPLLAFPIPAQSPGVPAANREGGNPSSHLPQDAPIFQSPEPHEARRLAALNAVRYKSMASDAARLLALAQELKASSDNMSTDERVHKAAEIQKLARSVKEKMSYVIGTGDPTTGVTTVIP
jgi:hypothetical protein